MFRHPIINGIGIMLMSICTACTCHEAGDNSGGGLFGEPSAEGKSSSRHEMIEQIKADAESQNKSGEELPVFEDGPKD